MFADIKVITRNHKSKDRQCNNQSSHSDIWISNHNIDIKQKQKTLDSLPLKKTTHYHKQWTINMHSTITGSDNACS
jgi:hypothetical protein